MNRTSTLPSPIIKRMRWPFPLIWIVPVVAAIAAGFYFREFFQARAETVTVSFNDGSGLEGGQTSVRHHGVEVERAGVMA